MWETDASGYGGGLVVPSLGPRADSRHYWLDHERPRSINFKELAEPELGLRAVQRQFPSKLGKQRGALQSQVMLGRLDNTTAVSYIQHQGGPIPTLSALAENLWFYLLEQGQWLVARHLAGVLNKRADYSSTGKRSRSASHSVARSSWKSCSWVSSW